MVVPCYHKTIRPKNFSLHVVLYELVQLLQAIVEELPAFTEWPTFPYYYISSKCCIGKCSSISHTLKDLQASVKQKIIIQFDKFIYTWSILLVLVPYICLQKFMQIHEICVNSRNLYFKNYFPRFNKKITTKIWSHTVCKSTHYNIPAIDTHMTDIQS